MADDDFLHQMRARPSPVFAARLKARLDRQPLRRRWALAGAVALLVAGVALALSMPEVRHWLGAPALQVHSRAADLALSATSSRSAAPTSSPSSLFRSASTRANTARQASPPVAGPAAAPQTRVAASTAETAAAAGPGAPSRASIVGFVPEAMSPLYTTWARAAPLFALNTGRKLNIELHPWPGDIHDLPPPAAAAFVVTSDSIALGRSLGQYLGFPLLVEGIVPIVHLEGVDSANLVLDGPTLAGIYLGEITVWNDPRIVRLNPNMDLPATPTLPIFRQGNAPLNAVFAGYLAGTDPTFSNQVGTGQTNHWPIGTGRGSDSEVAVSVAANNGAIGYVDFDYARRHGLTAPRLINAAGNPTRVSIESIQAGASLVCNDSNYFEQQPSPDPGAWPMDAVSFVLIPIAEPKPTQQVPDYFEAKTFFMWILRNGRPRASGLNYAALPDSLTQQLIANGLQLRLCP